MHTNLAITLVTLTSPSTLTLILALILKRITSAPTLQHNPNVSPIVTLHLTQTQTMILALSLTMDRNLTHHFGPDPEVKPHHVTEPIMALGKSLASIPTLSRTRTLGANV